MSDDLFQAVRRDGSGVVPKIEQLDDVNLVRKDGRSLLHEAIAYKNLPATWALLNRGVDVNIKDENGQTALHFAATYQNSVLLEAILSKGADQFATDQHGNTPLWAAVFDARGNYESVDVLLRHGGGHVVEMKNRYGRSPLDFALQIEDAALIQRLRIAASNA